MENFIKFHWEEVEDCQGRCPYCGSQKITGDGSSHIKSDIILIPVKCEACGRYFEEAYIVGDYCFTQYKVKDTNH